MAPPSGEDCGPLRAELVGRERRPRVVTGADGEGAWAPGSIQGQTKSILQALSPHRFFQVFSKRRSLELPQLRLPVGSTHISPLKSLLLLLSGQCPNPGPQSYPCGVCDRNVSRGMSFHCSSCLRWVHRACCGLRTKRDYDSFGGAWRCPACVRTQPPPPAFSPPSSPPSSPHSGLNQFSTASPPSGAANQIQGHFLQFNTNGIQNSSEQIYDLITKHNILVACIQETKLIPGAPVPNFGRYAVERRDRPSGGGGGLITLIHPSINYTTVDSAYFSDPITENLAIEVDLDGAKLLIINVYIPPVSSVAGQTPSLASLFDITRDVLIVGDFNAHDARWHSQTRDSEAARRGDAICNALDAGQLMCINGPSHTRRPQSGRTSSPDLSFTNPHLGINARWEPLVTLNSDHLPIIIDLDGWFSSPPESSGPTRYTNYRKADWIRFKRETERAFSYEQPPTSAESGEKIFRRILQKASRRNIPQGKIANYIPGLSPHSISLIQQRDQIRANNPNDPSITLLDEQIQRDCNKNNNERWREEVESCSIRWRPMKLWRLIQRLSGKRTYSAPNQPITFSGKSISDKRDIATKFVKFFTRPTPHGQNPATRTILRKLRNKHKLNHSSMPFTPNQVREALKISGSSTAPSPDGASAEASWSPWSALSVQAFQLIICPRQTPRHLEACNNFTTPQTR